MFQQPERKSWLMMRAESITVLRQILGCFIFPSNCLNFYMGPSLHSKKIGPIFLSLICTMWSQWEGSSQQLHICHPLQESHMWMKHKSEKKLWAIFFEWTEGPMQTFRHYLEQKKKKWPKFNIVMLSALQLLEGGLFFYGNTNIISHFFFVPVQYTVHNVVKIAQSFWSR